MNVFQTLRPSPLAKPANRRSLHRLLEPFEDIARNSVNLIARPLGSFVNEGAAYNLPRYVFVGPKGGGDPIRLGFFSLFEGDQPEGALGLLKVVQGLEREPDLARGYVLFFYPVCNPTGFEDATSTPRGGLPILHELWTETAGPEARFLRTEIWTHAFHGVTGIYASNAVQRITGSLNGAFLAREILEPALREGERVFPREEFQLRSESSPLAGLAARVQKNVLTIPALPNPPFELSLTTGRAAPLHRQVAAVDAAVRTILLEYRYLMAIAQNI
jgi:protein MpaA